MSQQSQKELDHPDFGPVRRTQFNTLKIGDTIIWQWAILGTVEKIVETSEMHGAMKIELDNGRRMKIQSWGHKRLWRKVDSLKHAAEV